MRGHRERLRMSRSELAEAIRVSADMIRQYETRGKMPRLDTFFAIAYALDVPLRDLVRDDHQDSDAERKGGRDWVPDATWHDNDRRFDGNR